MTHVVAIEFCADFFKTVANCMDWIKSQPEYSELLRVHRFGLRRNANAKLLTSERKRAVWMWKESYLGSHTRLAFHRPLPYVIIAVSDGPRFAPIDIPALLPSTVANEEKKAAAKRKRMEENKIKREEKNRTKPPKPKKPRVSKRKKKTEPEPEVPQFGIVVGAAAQQLDAANTLLAMTD